MKETILTFVGSSPDQDLTVTVTGWEEKEIDDYRDRLISLGFELKGVTSREIKRPTFLQVLFRADPFVLGMVTEAVLVAILLVITGLWR